MIISQKIFEKMASRCTDGCRGDKDRAGSTIFIKDLNNDINIK